MQAKVEGDFELAIRELAKAVSEEPGNAQAWFQYGTVLGWQKRYDEALVALDRGLALAPADYDLKMARVRVIAWQGHFDLASRELEKLAIEYSNSDEVLVMQGRIATWSGQLDQAEAYYQRVLDRNPRQVDALTGLGDIALERKNRDEAEVFFRRAYAIDPSADIQSRLDRLDNETLKRIDFGMTASTFGGKGRSDWWSIWTQYSQQTAYGTFWGRVEEGERFGVADTILEMGWEDRLNDNLETRVFLGAAPDAFWAAKWYAETNFVWTPEVSWPGLIAEFRYADYVPRGVFTSRLGLVRSFGEGWSTSLRWVHQEFESGEPTDGWILSVDKEYESGYGWRVGVANGAETLDGQALNFPSKVLESQTYFGGVRGAFNDRWGWRLDFEYEDYDVGANRRGVAMGIHHKF
jgi:YaiO family outer membrane protein